MSDTEECENNESKKEKDISIDDCSFEAELSKYIDDNLVGQKTTFRGPFGRKRVVYSDSMSTGDYFFVLLKLNLGWHCLFLKSGGI